jgi:hypothetical protein
MTEPKESTSGVVHAVEHPVETVEAIVTEADEGRSPWTPLIALSGITVIILAVVALLLAIAFTAYFLA